MKHILSLLFACMLSGVALAQQDFFHKIAGQWEGDGKLFGHDAKFTMKWTYVLDSTFARLDFTNQIKGAESQFVAVGYYPIKAKSEGSWMDNRGVSQSLELSFSPNQMTVIWVSSAERGKTVYTMTENGIVEARDFVFKESDWHPFGSAKYMKQATVGRPE